MYLACWNFWRRSSMEGNTLVCILSLDSTGRCDFRRKADNEVKCILRNSEKLCPVRLFVQISFEQVKPCSAWSGLRIRACGKYSRNCRVELQRRWENSGRTANGSTAVGRLSPNCTMRIRCSVPEELRRLSQIVHAQRVETHQTGTYEIGGDGIVSQHDPSEITRRTMQWPVALHANDPVGDDEVRWNSGVDIEDASIDALSSAAGSSASHRRRPAQHRTGSSCSVLRPPSGVFSPSASRRRRRSPRPCVGATEIRSPVNRVCSGTLTISSRFRSTNRIRLSCSSVSNPVSARTSIVSRWWPGPSPTRTVSCSEREEGARCRPDQSRVGVHFGAGMYSTRFGLSRTVLPRRSRSNKRRPSRSVRSNRPS